MSYKHKIKDLKRRKREALNEDFNSSKERKHVVETFKREARSLKRSEKNEIKNEIKKKFGI